MRVELRSRSIGVHRVAALGEGVGASPGLQRTTVECGDRGNACVTAAFACVQVRDNDAQDWVAVTGRVPLRAQQTASAAERFAILVVGVLASQGSAVHLVSDCQSALAEVQHVRRFSRFTAVWGGLWKQLPKNVFASFTRAHSHRGHVVAEDPHLVFSLGQ